MLLHRLKRYAAFFLIGAIGYTAIEMIWRGRTHPSMALAGGICFILFSLVAEGFTDMPLLVRALLAAFGVTLVELVFGLIFNIMLGMRVWDYSNMPLNFLGQICPLFSLFWVGIALLFLPLADRLNRRIKI